MNKILKIVKVLSWINMIIWIFVSIVGLLIALGAGTPAALVVIIFPSAVVLHSYASFQLQKSIRNPAIPLNRQTPMGIRFIGFVALFVGISMLVNGISTAAQPHAYLKQWQDMQEQMNLKKGNFIPTRSMIVAAGLFSLLVGLSVAVNVNLNFRLLRWYNYIRENSDKSDNSGNERG
jgi:hypothetical protein